MNATTDSNTFNVSHNFMTGHCKLLDIESELKESHIWPKFVIDYVKKTGSQYFRNLNKPNKREQDGLKEYLLCEDAEQLFSIREKWFSENIFIPYLDNNIKSFHYDKSLYFFGMSFLWRVLIMHLDFAPQIQGEWFFPILKKANDEWKNYLVNQIPPETFSNLQLMFTDRIKDTNINAVGLDFYLTRALDITIITSDDKKYLAVYGKFLRFIFWSVLKSEKSLETTSTTINSEIGDICFPQQINDTNLMSFLTNRTKEIEKLPQPSERQLDIISKERNRDNGQFWNTDAGKSILNDIFNLDKKNCG